MGYPLLDRPFSVGRCLSLSTYHATIYAHGIKPFLLLGYIYTIPPGAKCAEFVVQKHACMYTEYKQLSRRVINSLRYLKTTRGSVCEDRSVCGGYTVTAEDIIRRLLLFFTIQSIFLYNARNDSTCPPWALTPKKLERCASANQSGVVHLSSSIIYLHVSLREYCV